MKRIAGISLLSGGVAVALATTLAGCGSSDTTAPAQNETVADQSHEGHDHAAPEKTVAPGAALGSEQATGPFHVTLTMNPKQAKVGDATFTAKVKRNGQPVEDAKVELHLSMPTMSMPGPEEELKHTGGGTYAGKTNVGMGGYWQAEVEVEAGEAEGKAIYEFTAMQE
jgi:hypothetical protein